MLRFSVSVFLSLVSDLVAPASLLLPLATHLTTHLWPPAPRLAAKRYHRGCANLNKKGFDCNHLPHSVFVVGLGMLVRVACSPTHHRSGVLEDSPGTAYWWFSKIPKGI